MLFNSLTFAGFFAVVYATYLSMYRHRRAQNAMLLVASYVFYAAWDWRFLSLIWISTGVDYLIGARLGRSKGSNSQRRILLMLSVGVNLGLLGVFKYFDFFADGFATMLGALSLDVSRPSLDIILPVGISFYTFQTMSYTIDIYRGRLQPSDRLLDFALFVAFFPQLVAGPIERARNLLPQIQQPRRLSWSQIDAGGFLILWGLFKKMVIADNMAVIVGKTLDHPEQVQGLDLILGTVAFAVQIYGDFSGYSDIARGLAKLMGFDLMVNFKLPYFARTPSEFWSRWHVSLSGWLRDYLYIPLGGNRGGTLLTHRNLLLTMLLGGLWHGAAWNFVLWGLFHGLLLIIYRPFTDRALLPASWTTDPVGRWLADALATAIMFTLTLFGWILFRCSSVDQIGLVLGGLGVGLSEQSAGFAYELAFFSLPLLAVQIAQLWTDDLLAPTRIVPGARGLLYGALVCGLLVFGVRESMEFIYFRF